MFWLLRRNMLPLYLNSVARRPFASSPPPLPPAPLPCPRLDTDGRLSPKSFKFRKNRFGKPEIGIDIEEKQRKTSNDILSLAHRYFTSVEVAYLKTLADPECRQSEFIRLWTLKEAYVKALGRGFSGAPFKDFTIRLEASNGKQVTGESKSDGPSIVVEAVDDPGILMNRWKFAFFELNSHYTAVCMERDVKNPADGENNSLKLKVWRTLPFVEDECVTETDAVKNIIR